MMLFLGLLNVWMGAALQLPSHPCSADDHLGQGHYLSHCLLGSSFFSTPADDFDFDLPQIPCGRDAWVWQRSHVESASFDFSRPPLGLAYRWGEAQNPGPPFHISFCNPSGLRGKEHVLYNSARGIQNVAETHLATPGLQASCGLLRSMAAQDQRRLRLLPGVAVPLRARSLTTGTWAGVWQSADVPCTRLNLQWPQHEAAIRRAQAATFHHHSTSILGVVLYAWAPGPTWPKAKTATRTLLRYLTEEIVLGSSGMRFISGDFNGSETDYPELQEWIDAGWQDVQTLQQRLHGTPPVPTCKGVTSPDKLFVSPELAALFISCSVKDVFAA